MNKEELAELLRQHLKIEISNERSYLSSYGREIEVTIKFDDEYVSSAMFYINEAKDED